MGYVLARINELKTELAAMPAVDVSAREVSKQEAIRRLAPEIALLLQKKGYRHVDIVKLLGERGVAISLGTLKTYLARLKPGRSRKHSARPQATPAPSAPAAEGSPAVAVGNRAGGSAVPTQGKAPGPRGNPPKTSAETGTGIGKATPAVAPPGAATTSFTAREDTEDL